MKFLAILKDSLRETLDTKVFYVMVGFSLLVILLVGSIGYHPVSAEEEAHRLTDQMTWFLEHFGDKRHLETKQRWDIKDFEQLKPGVAPWQTGYRFALTIEFTDEEQAKQAKRVQRLSLAALQQQLRAGFAYLKNLKVTDAPPKDPKEIRYLVTTDASDVSRAQDWPHYPVFLFVLPMRFWRGPVGDFVQFWESYLVNWIGAAIALLISTIITAFFIPNMLRRGTVDLLLVKPISRTTLLLYKYIGGLTFIFLNTVVVVVGIWLVLGLRTNMWGTGFLLSIFVLTFQFALYYAVSTLFGVLSRSPIVAILMTCLFWFVFAFVIGYGYYWLDLTRKFRDMMEVQTLAQGQEMPSKEMLPEKTFPDAVYTTADIIHFLTPHLNDLDTLTDKWILEDVTPRESPQRKAAEKKFAGFRWTEAISVTSIYIVVLLAVSCWWFARKDY
jgi:ABC-type transport system involved in multi-copper enzyme maturation permease subunit